MDAVIATADVLENHELDIDLMHTPRPVELSGDPHAAEMVSEVTTLTTVTPKLNPIMLTWLLPIASRN